MKEINKGIESLLQKMREEKRLEAESLAQRELEFSAQQSGVFLVSTLIGVADKRAGTLAGAIGNAGLGIQRALEKFNAAGIGQKNLSSIVLTGDMVGIAMNLVGAVVGGPSPDEIVIQQINELRKQIDELGKVMNSRFDYVDRSLNTIYSGMLSGFRELHFEINQLKIDVKEMRVSLKNMENSHASIRQMLHSYLEAGFGRAVEGNAVVCLAATSLSYVEYQKCLTQFEYFSNEVSRDAVEAGDPHSEILANCPKTGDFPCVLAGIAGLASSSWSQRPSPIWSKINLWSFIASEYLDDPFVAVKTRLPNPTTWSRFAQAFSQFAYKHPDFLRYEDTLRVATNLMETGADLKYSLSNILAPAPLLGKKREPSQLFTYVVTQYKLSLQELSNAIAAEIRSKNNRDRKDRFGYRFWDDNRIDVPVAISDELSVGREGASRFRLPEAIPYCGQSNPKDPFSKVALDGTNSKLNAVLNRYEFLPKEFLVSHHLAMGNLWACWESASFPLSGRTDRMTLPEERWQPNTKFLVFLGHTNVTIRFGFSYLGAVTVIKRVRVATQKDHIGVEKQHYENGPRVSRLTGEQLITELKGMWASQMKDFDSGLTKVTDEALPSDTEASQTLTLARARLIEIRNLWRKEQLDGKHGIREAILNGSSGNPIAEAAARLEGARRLIDVYSQLGMPTALQRDELRSVLYGRDYIMGKYEIADLLTVSQLDARKVDWDNADINGNLLFADEARARVDRFLSIVKPISETERGEQTHDVIASTMFQLSLIKKLGEAARPKIPIETAIAEVLEKARSYKE